MLLPVVVIAAVALTMAWIRREVLAGQSSNPAKHLYVASTAALFGLMLVDPVAGLIGYVGSHSLEYFVIVYTNLKSRYQDHPEDPAIVGRAVRSPVGRPGFLVLYLGSILVILAVLQRFDSPTIYALVFFTLGGLHVFYDGFIWKLRRNKVARSFDLPTGVAR